MIIKKFVTLPTITSDGSTENISFNVDRIVKIIKDPEFNEDRSIIYLIAIPSDGYPYQEIFKLNISRKKAESLLNGKF